MTQIPLTLKNIRARPVLVPLKRPVVSNVGLFREWPLILIDLYTNEGVVGHSYLEPYLKQSIRYIIPAIEDLAAAAKGQPIAPFDCYRRGIGSLHIVGREGVSLIAVSGLDMAMWDAMAKAASMPLAVYLGGTIGLGLIRAWIDEEDKQIARKVALAFGSQTGVSWRGNCCSGWRKMPKTRWALRFTKTRNSPPWGNPPKFRRKWSSLRGMPCKTRCKTRTCWGVLWVST